MSFVYPWLLALLPLVPLFAIVSLWLSHRASRRLALFVSPSLQERFRLKPESTRSTIQIILASLGLALLIVASARPQWGRADLRVTSRGRNLLIALDVSRSMLAADVRPNRLERAKVDLLDLIGDLEGDRAGLLAFRGKASMICPLTTDRAFLRQALDGITIDSAPSGETDIADAIGKCLSAFDKAYSANNAVILISDGEDLAGRAEKLAKEAGARSIPIFTVGLGDPEGSEIPAADGNGSMRFQGDVVKTKLAEKTLQAIAAASGGAYIPLATSGTARTTLGAIYRQHLTRIAAKELEEILQRRLVERYQLFLVPALALILAAACLSRGRLASGNRRGGSLPHRPADVATMVVAMLLALCSVSSAQETNVASALPFVSAGVTFDDAETGTGTAGAREAQRLFKRGKYADAAEGYLAAARGLDDIEAAARYRHNAGLASYLVTNYAQTAEILSPIIASRGFASTASLFGAAQFKLAAGEAASTNNALKAQALEKSAMGFQHALRENPSDAQTARNLSRALANLPAIREAAHIEEILEKHGQTPPPQLIDKMLAEQRTVLSGCEGLVTNSSAAETIAAMEALAARQRDVTDLFIPMKSALIDSQMITNELQRAQTAQLIEDTRDLMKRTTDYLEDVDFAAIPLLARSEETLYSFWKNLAMPPALLNEGILAQTNAFANPDSPRYAARSDWNDALELTDRFMALFPQWAKEKIQEHAADTNKPPFTAEDAAEITKHMESLHWIQDDAVKNTDRTQRKTAAHEALVLQEKVRELMPKDNSEQPPPSQQPPPPQDKPEESPQKQPEASPPPEEEQNEEQAEDAEENEPPPNVQEAMRRALEREREHEREKNEQRRRFPMPPTLRDW